MAPPPAFTAASFTDFPYKRVHASLARKTAFFTKTVQQRWEAKVICPNSMGKSISEPLFQQTDKCLA